MKTNQTLASQPYANICINKSRLKIYHKETTPTYYLEKDSEFEIELFNGTQNVVLAKIILNGKAITQGGLVLRPAERVFLERYIDVAKKFKFDTYEVSNTEEVKQAIKSNGDFKVEFYSEYIPISYNPTITISTPWIINNIPPYNGIYYQNTGGYVYNTGTPLNGTLTNTTSVNYNQTISNSDAGNVNCNYSAPLHDGEATLDWMCGDNVFNDKTEEPKVKSRSASLFSKKIETGRVEQGSDSSQSFKTIDKQFNSWAFHTVEYKLLPISQKVNTTEDIKVRQYCGNCGSKNKNTPFCPNCGKKI